MAGRHTTRTDLNRHLESSFQIILLNLARQCGWRHYHTHDSRKSPSGFPDLVLVRERVIFAELKGETTPVEEEQQEWLTMLSRAGAEVYLWRRSDWDDISTTLTTRVPSGRLQVFNTYQIPEESR